MQEEFLTSVAHIKKKLRLDIDSASAHLTVYISGGRLRIKLRNGLPWRVEAQEMPKKPAAYQPSIAPWLAGDFGNYLLSAESLDKGGKIIWPNKALNSKGSIPCKPSIRDSSPP